jgi:uncharacterized protein (UPF0333 family)
MKFIKTKSLFQKINSRGQVNSPFELLVAIIIMGFVILIGTQMIASANDQVCFSVVKKEMVEFSDSLENSSEYRTSTKFSFRPNEKQCYNESQSIMKIVKYANQTKCSAVCGQPLNSCFIMVFGAEDIVNGYEDICLNIPTYTSFVSDTTTCPTNEPSLNGYNALEVISTGKNLTLPSGTYIIRNVAPAGKTYPVICTYWRP